MSEQLDVVGHGISAASGGLVTVIVQRVIGYFSERDRQRKELELVATLAKLETKIDLVLTQNTSRELLSERVAKLEAKIEQFERSQ